MRIVCFQDRNSVESRETFKLGKVSAILPAIHLEPVGAPFNPFQNHQLELSLPLQPMLSPSNNSEPSLVQR